MTWQLNSHPLISPRELCKPMRLHLHGRRRRPRLHRLGRHRPNLVEVLSGPHHALVRCVLRLLPPPPADQEPGEMRCLLRRKRRRPRRRLSRHCLYPSSSWNCSISMLVLICRRLSSSAKSTRPPSAHNSDPRTRSNSYPWHTRSCRVRNRSSRR